ncbi:MAG TPA: sigma-70 family RNA polymerase sigma factor [Bacteroidales bacterium]|nr:sigma-70 family RNA polymerase sigma factor [Bacteroidales bacterium]HSA43329.1 sigma-70 family RNA polymerase sigma factor [Bacteroidales bacterium]
MSDEALLQRLRDPETVNAAFRELVKRYQEKIYWLVRRMVLNHEDADDLVQNIFLKVYTNLHAFKGASSLYTWIYRIAVNEVFSHLKSMRKNVFVSYDTVSAKLENTLRYDPGISADLIQERFQKAMLKLPPKQRLVFQMKYYESDLTFEKMSDILDTSSGALKASYHQAVKKIEKMMLDD